MTSDPDDYRAVSQSPASYTLDDIFEHMTREGSTVTRAEALAGFEEVTQSIINLVQQGNSVVTPLVNISPSVSGVFDGEDDRYDPDRHQININIAPGVRLRDTAADIPIQKVGVQQRQPKLVHFYDNETGKQDKVITPNSGARITGSLLKFDEDDQNQGVFFIIYGRRHRNAGRGQYAPKHAVRAHFQHPRPAGRHLPPGDPQHAVRHQRSSGWRPLGRAYRGWLRVRRRNKRHSG